MFSKYTQKTTSLYAVLLVVLSVCVLIYIGVGADLARAAFNPEINYQGKLTNASNVAVADGVYHMKFRLYTAASGGTLLAEENRSFAVGDRVNVRNGLFSVMLGSSTSLTSVDFNQELWLEVQVGGTASSSWETLSPRKPLGAVPAAFESDKLDGLDSTQFVRTDTASTIASTSASTLLTINQSGTGNILDLKDAGTTVFTVRDGGNVGIGTTSPFTKLSVGGSTYLGGNLTATGTITFTALSDGCVNVTAGVLGSTSCGSLFGQSWEIANGALSPTTTLGVGVYASSTIGNGTAQGGLTISGGATTTGNAYVAGSVGIGIQAPTELLHVFGADATIQVGNSTDSSSYSTFNDVSATQLLISKTTSSGAPIIDIAPAPTDGSSNATVRFFRNTNTSGGVALTILRGNNTTSVNTQLGGNTNSYFNALTGNVGIGTTSPFAKLSVAGAAYIGGNLTATGTITFTGLSDGPLQAIAGVVSATSTISSNFLDTNVILSSEIDTVSEIETLAGGVNILLETEIDASSELAALMDDETGSGALVFGTNATLASTTLSLNTLLTNATTTSLGVTTICFTGDTCRTSWPTGGGATFGQSWEIANGALSPTTTLGVGVYASSTIGNGTAQGGLTISGGATTTGNAYFAGNVGIATTSPFTKLSVGGSTYLGGNLTATGTITFTGLSDGPLQSVAGVLSATSSIVDVFVTDALTLSGGVIGSNSISGTLTTTGTLTIGDNGDRIDVASSGWDVTNSVFTGGTWQGNVIGTTYGGTGLASTPTNGQLLIGDGLGYTLGTIGGGSGLTTTNGAGTIDIDCDVASGTVAGCLSTTAWAIFNNKISSTSIDTSAELAALITDETGTAGNLVFSTNPLLTGFRSFASSTVGDTTQGGGLTISGGATTTGTAYVAGNMGIGSSSPYAKLSITQTGTAPAFLVEDSTSPDNTPFIIDATGRVGVGFDAPVSKFHLGHNSDTSWEPMLDLSDSNSYPFTLQNLNSQNGSTTGIGFAVTNSFTQVGGSIIFTRTGTNSKGTLGFYTKTTTTSAADPTLALLIDDSSRIGIGTSTPNWSLQIASTSAFMALTDSDAGTNAKHWLLSSSNGDFNIGTSSDALSATSSYFVIKNGGAIGIGTTTPYAKLSVWGTSVLDTAKAFEVANSASSTLFAIFNDGDISIGSSTATTTMLGGLSINNGAVLYDYSTNQTSIENLNLGPISFDTDAGAVSWIDMPITASAPNGTTESYSAQIDSQQLLTIWAQSTGAGSIKNTRVVVGTTTDAILGSTNIPYGSFVVADGIICVDDSAASNCDDAARVRGRIYASNSTVTAIDLAENYPTLQTDLGPGEIVMLDEQDAEICTNVDTINGPATCLASSTDSVPFVSRADRASTTPRLLGIISTEPGVLLGGFASDELLSYRKVPVALSGRVPLKVNIDNGEIKAGDQLTLSNTPGVAMKAATTSPIVAIALEGFDGTRQVDATTTGPTTSTTSIKTKPGEGVIIAFVHLEQQEGVSQLALDVELIKQQLALLSGTTTGAFGGQTFDIVTLEDTSTTTLAQASSTASILATALGGLTSGVGFARDFIAARFIAVERLFASVITFLPGGTLEVPEGENEASGTGVVRAGTTEATILNTLVATTSKIFVTPTALTNVPLAVTNKDDGVGFTVTIGNPQAEDITFDWFLIQSYSTGGESEVIAPEILEVPLPEFDGGNIGTGTLEIGTTTPAIGDETGSSTPETSESESSAATPESVIEVEEPEEVIEEEMEVSEEAPELPEDLVPPAV